MATLAVLPIYGWIRRQFNPVLAILGGALYALHPAMVHDSPLIVRDPTFWLLFALGLYSSWRAVAEMRKRWFLVFALVFTLNGATASGWQYLLEGSGREDLDNGSVNTFNFTPTFAGTYYLTMTALDEAVNPIATREVVLTVEGGLPPAGRAPG